MREAIHRLGTATAFRLKPEATLTVRVEAGRYEYLAVRVASGFSRKAA